MGKAKFSPKNVREFLQQSNYIERVYGDIGLEDAVIAWEAGLKYMKKYKRISIAIIKIMHKNLLTRLNEEIAGKIRDTTVYIGNNKKDQTKEEINVLLKDLVKRVPKKEEEIKQWHIDFENIHPFEDGNGRVGRIIMNLQRHILDLPLLIIYEGKEQYDYYKWFDGRE